jgi:peptidyl-prolyl cis-trans isomerase SurA
LIVGGDNAKLADDAPRLMACHNDLMAVAVASTGRAQQAIVSEQITELEIEQRSKFTEAITHKARSRQEVIDELRNEKLKVQEARKSGVVISDSKVDEAVAEMARRMNLTSERLSEIFVSLGSSTDTLKHRIRADLAWQEYTRSSR